MRFVTRDKHIVPFVAAAAVPGQEPALLLSRWFSGTWTGERLFADAARHGTAAALAENLVRLLPHLSLDPAQSQELAQRSEQSRRQAIFDLLGWELEARRVLDVLSVVDSGPLLVLKGGGLKYTAYPDPWFRSSTDLDILLPDHSTKRHAGALLEAGFEVVVSDPNRPWTSTEGHHLALARTGFGVELHRSVDNNDRSGLDWQTLAREARPVPELHPAATALSMEHAAVVVAVHALKHGLDVPLRDLVDLHFLVHREGTDWDQAVAIARAQDVGGVLGFLLTVCQELFCSRVPPHLLEELRPSLPKTLALRAVLSAWRPGFFATGLAREGQGRKLLAHALLTEQAQTTFRVLGKYAGRRLRDLGTRPK